MSGAIEHLDLVDPDLRAVALQMRQTYARFHPMNMERLVERRAWLAGMPQPALLDVPVDERRIAGPAGAPDVTVLVINAKPGGRRPGILHIHGGGLNGGTARAGLYNLQALAETLDCAIVTVDYRIAPETIYAGSIEDNYAGLKWTHDHAGELGIDPARIALLGESAGGCHAALLAIAARDRGEVPLLFQALIYPMLDDRTGSSRRPPAHIGAFGWNSDSNSFGWRCFLGQEPGGADVPVGAVPARVGDLSGLPPAFIGVGALDVLVGDSIDYGRRLIEAGVRTELVVVPGAFHGFDAFAGDSAVSKRFTAMKIDALRRAFAATRG